MKLDPGDVPMPDVLAYLLTWTTYGAWLPGDPRGWVEKPGRFRAPDAKVWRASRIRMRESEVRLNAHQRVVVERTIARHCSIRGWHLHAVNCRTQHVHVVVTALHRDPRRVMDEFKAWCTRRLKEEQRREAEPVRRKWWTQGGSKRRLYTESSVEAAIEYVLEYQDYPREFG